MGDSSTSTLSPDAQKAWEELTASYQRRTAAAIEFSKLKRSFLDQGVDLVDLLSQVDGPKYRGIVLEIAGELDVDGLKRFFPRLIGLASTVHGGIQTARNLILRIPKDWLLENIERYADPLIEESCEDDYRRFLELYDQIDEGLTRRLAERALCDKDPGVREAGQDFLSD